MVYSPMDETPQFDHAGGMTIGLLTWIHLCLSSGA